MIEFKNVSFEYEKGIPVLHGVSLEIEDDERVGLIGANGASKTTLMKTLLGLLPYTGDILVDGIRVEKGNYPQIRKKIGFVLQNSDNQMFMPTVLDDMLFGLVNYGMSREEAERKVDSVLEMLHLTELKNKYNHKMSGGEKRMAAIATVIAMDPKFIVMDEPSVSLDPYNRRLVINTIRDLNQTKIIASHDLDMISELCDRVILLSKGSVVTTGRTQDILGNRELLEANRMELPLTYLSRTI